MARRLRPAQPSAAFGAAGVRLLAPFALLAGDASAAGPLADRGPHHPPEFQPLAAVGDGGKAQTIGYWRDDPSAPPGYVVQSKPLAVGQPGLKFDVVGESLLAVLHALLTAELKRSPIRAGEIRGAVAALEGAAAAAGVALDGGSGAAARRRKEVVGKTSHGMGIVVPYDKKTELGYRELNPSGTALRKLLGALAAASGAARDAHQAELDELINWANIANDECDFGASLQLGHDLFNHSAAAFAEPAARVLQTAYALLGRDAFGKLAVDHAKVRAR